MSEMIFQEADFFNACFLNGIFLLFVYDLFRILRRIINHEKLSVAVEDLLFWIVGSIWVFRIIYQKNNGVIRGTAFLAMGAGMLLYHYGMSRYVIRVGYGIFGKTIKKIATFLYKGLKKR